MLWSRIEGGKDRPERKRRSSGRCGKDEQLSRVVFIGAGALGVMFGWQMTQRLGREQVCFLADEKRVARYETDGFSCNGTPCALRFTTDAAAEGPADLVVFAVKFSGLPAAIELARPLVGEGTALLSLLNGISSEQMLIDAFGAEHVLYCVAQKMDAVKEGNAITYGHMGDLQIGLPGGGTSPLMERTLALLTAGGVPHELPEDILHSQWSKLMLNTGVNQVTAAYGLSYAGIQKDGEPRRKMIAAMEEVRAVAAAEGVQLTEEEVQQWLISLDGLNPEGMTSMRQDRKAGRRTEVELFSGTIRRLGQAHGIPTPVNDELYAAIRKAEEADARE